MKTKLITPIPVRKALKKLGKDIKEARAGDIVAFLAGGFGAAFSFTDADVVALSGKTYAEIGQQFSSIFFNKVGLKIQTPTFYLSLGVILQSVFVSSLIQGI